MVQNHVPLTTTMDSNLRTYSDSANPCLISSSFLSSKGTREREREKVCREVSWLQRVKIWGSLSLPSRFKPDLGLFRTFGVDLSTSPGCDCSHTSPCVGSVGIEPTLTRCKSSGLTARQAGPYRGYISASVARKQGGCRDLISLHQKVSIQLLSSSPKARRQSRETNSK